MKLGTSFLLASVSLTWLSFAHSAAAQVSHGGVPPSTWADLQLPLVALEIDGVDVGVQRTRVSQPKAGDPLYYGAVVPVSLSADEIGSWELLPSNDLVWRLSIQSIGAQSLSVIFSQFDVPPGGELYVHARGEQRVLGAYTSLEANVDGSFAFEPLAGEELVLEYFEPAGADFHATLELGSVVHDFLGVLDLLDASGQGPTEAAGACEVDVNCPAGNSYQNEKRAVVRLLSNGALCSGAMINNVANDGRRFMMTAFHCGSMNNAILYFNYERPSCGSGSPTTQTVSGTSSKASNKKYDFRLTEVTPVIPTAYNHFFLGWDRTGSIPASTVCIHHPAGDVKKISFDNHSPVKQGNDWRILQWDLGVTEGGSSGSPLMTPTGRFIGQLWGGASFCGYPYDDYYRRFELAWPAVKGYLDPSNSGATTIAGYDP